jgi:hypothetical protein
MLKIIVLPVSGTAAKGKAADEAQRALDNALNNNYQLVSVSKVKQPANGEYLHYVLHRKPGPSAPPTYRMALQALQ